MKKSILSIGLLSLVMILTSFTTPETTTTVLDTNSNTQVVSGSVASTRKMDVINGSVASTRKMDVINGSVASTRKMDVVNGSVASTRKMD